jgi:hypothetical protein
MSLHFRFLFPATASSHFIQFLRKMLPNDRTWGLHNPYLHLLKPSLQFISMYCKLSISFSVARKRNYETSVVRLYSEDPYSKLSRDSLNEVSRSTSTSETLHKSV